jgi:hypothetical protein
VFCVFDQSLMGDGSYHAETHYPIITHSNVHLTARKSFVLKDTKRHRLLREREAVLDDREFATRTVHASKPLIATRAAPAFRVSRVEELPRACIGHFLRLNRSEPRRSYRLAHDTTIQLDTCRSGQQWKCHY